MEKAIFDSHLPRYYEGYDLNALWKKDQNGEKLTDEEGMVLIKVMDEIYDKLYHEHRKKEVKKEILEKQNTKPMIVSEFIGPIIPLNGKTKEDILLKFRKKQQKEYDEIYKELLENGGINYGKSKI